MRERLVVVWRVTTHCNLSCPFCACDRTLERPRRTGDVSLIEQTGAVLAEWRRMTGRPVLVSWLGGEPLLWKPLEELTNRFHRLGLLLSTTTNGTPLSRQEMRRHLIERYAELTVSLDSFAEDHDSLRGRSGLFSQVRRDIRSLAAEIPEAGSRLILRANVVLMRRTVEMFPQLCRELASWGIREITCNQLGGADRPEFFPANRLLPAQVERLQSAWPDLQKELAGEGVRLLGGSEYLQRMAASTRGEKLDVTDCDAGQDFVFIDEAGRAAPCSFTGDDYGVGLRELTTGEDWNSLPARLAEMRRCSRSRHCSDCLSTHVFRKFAKSA